MSGKYAQYHWSSENTMYLKTQLDTTSPLLEWEC